MLAAAAKKPLYRYPSINNDSGISMYSYSTYAPYSDECSDDTLRSSKVDSRRFRKPLPIPPPAQAAAMPMPPGHHTSTLPRLHELSGDSYTTAVCTFSDEKVPYRIRLPGHHITLKQFKEHLPKKGNFR